MQEDFLPKRLSIVIRPEAISPFPAICPMDNFSFRKIVSGIIVLTGTRNVIIGATKGI